MTTTNNVNLHLSQYYRHIYEQYAESASFYWQLRTLAANRPDYTYADLCAQNQRLNLTLDGLMTAPDIAWSICETALSLQQPGEIFVAAIIAFRCADEIKIKAAVKAGLIDNQCRKGLISALAWLPGRLVHNFVKNLLQSHKPTYKALALAVCLARRENPKNYLNRILEESNYFEDEQLHGQALRVIGELKRFDLQTTLQPGIASQNSSVYFWMLRSQILLGDKSQAAQMEPYLFSDNPFKFKAASIIFRTLPVETAKKWISAMSKIANNQRLMIHSVATLGDPEAVKWLIEQMHHPKFGRLSGYAFSLISGIDLKDHHLTKEPPQNIDVDTADDCDEFELIMDDFLPHPDPHKITSFWQKIQNDFKSGQRYFVGHPLAQDQATLTHLKNIFKIGTQPQRASAALEIALRDPQHILMSHQHY